MLPTNNSVPIESVVVAESGDDSDDGWDYIKVNKDKAEQQEQLQQESAEEAQLMGEWKQNLFILLTPSYIVVLS